MYPDNNELFQKLAKEYLEKKCGYTNTIKKYSDKKPVSKEVTLDGKDLSSLIDLALMTGDKEWFMELTEKMKVVTV